MINSIIYFSIKNKLIVGLLTLALIAAGIYSMFTMNLGSLPDITNNQVQIITASQNLATEDIEQFVTFPVELAMANLPGVIEIRSISRFGLSVVTIVFKDDMGTYLPRQLVQEKLNLVKQQIPEQFGNPYMGPITTGLGEIYQYTLQPKPGYETRYSPTELRTIQDWIVKRQMGLVEGVVGINSFGGKVKQYEIAINPQKLNANNISISEVFEALRRNNANTGGAYIEKNNMANFIRGEGLVRSLDDIRNIVVKNVDGIPILIRDVAEKVHFGHQVRYGAFTQDGKEAVGGMILMLRGSNSNAVIHDVQERIADIQKSLPEGLEIKPFLDRSALIERTTSTVAHNLIEGALIVIFVLVLLLGSLRGGIITASTIPLSLLFAFVMMRLFDVSGNLISLGAIDFGIIVDGVVIIVERTVYEIQKRLRSGEFSIDQNVMDEITYRAGSSMMSTAFFGQIIILLVFIPILSLTGIEGKMFHPMAYTLGFAMLGAIILCLTYVPMMSALLLKPATNKRTGAKNLGTLIESAGEKLVSGFHGAYLPILKKALRYKAIVLIVTIMLVSAAALTFYRMGSVFIPQLDEGDIAMQALIRPGSSLKESIDVSIAIENILLKNFPEIKTVLSRIGVADIPTDPMPMDLADMFIILEKDRDKWTSAQSKDELIEKIKAKLDSELTGVNLVFSQPVELRFNELLTGVREDVAVKLYGDDLGVLAEKVEQMADIIRTIPGVGDVNPERVAGLPQMTVRYDREKIAQYGLNVDKLNEYISSAFAGGVAGIVFEEEKRFEMVIRFDNAYQQGIDDLRNLFIDLPNGHQIPIKELAEINYFLGPMQISRENAFRRTYVGVNTRGRDVESVVKDIQQKLDAELHLPPGYYLTYGGEFENLQSAKERLTILVPIVLFLIFVLLFLALKSVSQSIIIFIGVPLAAIGGIFALWLRDMPFSISAGVGFIVVFGIAVLDDLVLMDRFNTLKAEGITSIKQRILLATKERIRPILLADTTDIFGFLPMALSETAGSEVQHPLSTVVIGGLITSAMFTLIVLPVLYAIVESNNNVSKNTRYKRKNVLLMLTACGMLFSLLLITTSPANAQSKPIDSLQTISLEQARELAIKNFPQIQAARLEIESQEALKKTAWDLGNTSVFTGGEEMGHGSNGVYTQIGIQQRQIDVFGIAPKLKLQEERVALAENALDLSILEVEREVSRAWAMVFTAKNIYQVYQRLESIFTDIERAARIRLEVEATSKLEYLATSNQGNQVQIQKEQAYRDYLSALQKLNLWLVRDILYTVEDISQDQLDSPLSFIADSLEDHPVLNVSKQQVNVADAAIKERSAQFLPKLNLQYGKQEIAGQQGFHQFQAGIQIPLFFGPELGRSQAAKIQRSIAVQNLQQTQLELKATYQNIREQYLKWHNSWQYYRDTALPMAREQQAGAVIAYQEGAIDYVTFLQNMRDAIRIEVDSWNAFGSYLDNRYQMEYFLRAPVNSEN